MEEISVIMGIYNCAATLEEAVQSLVNQTYTKWKLIMCDDASTDNTFDIAQKLAQKFEGITVIKNEKNMGLNYTLNRCLEMVDTEYVARMDGDDISLPSRFEKEISFLRNNKEFSIVSTSMIHFDETGEWGVSRLKQIPQKSDLIKGTPFCHAPCMVKTEAYRAVGGYTVDKKLIRMEDYHLWYKMYLRGYKGYNIEEPLYKMRDDRNASKRRKYRYRINEAYVKTLIIRKYHLSKINYLHVVKPLIVGILPMPLYEYLHKKKLNR